MRHVLLLIAATQLLWRQESCRRLIRLGLAFAGGTVLYRWLDQLSPCIFIAAWSLFAAWFLMLVGWLTIICFAIPLGLQHD